MSLRAKSRSHRLCHSPGFCQPKVVFFLCLPDKERTKESAPRANHTLHYALCFVVSASRASALTPHMLRHSRAILSPPVARGTMPWKIKAEPEGLRRRAGGEGASGVGGPAPPSFSFCHFFWTSKRNGIPLRVIELEGERGDKKSTIK